MARKGIIEKEKKRQKLTSKFADKRVLLKRQIRNSNSFSNTFALSSKLEKLPLNSLAIRLRNRCFITGKPRGFYRDFGLSRNMLREMGHNCLIPGLIKSSW